MIASRVSPGGTSPWRPACQLLQSTSTRSDNAKARKKLRSTVLSSPPGRSPRGRTADNGPAGTPPPSLHGSLHGAGSPGSRSPSTSAGSGTQDPATARSSSGRAAPPPSAQTRRLATSRQELAQLAVDRAAPERRCRSPSDHHDVDARIEDLAPSAEPFADVPLHAVPDHRTADTATDGNTQPPGTVAGLRPPR